MLKVVISQPTLGLLRMISNKYMSLWNFPNCVGAIDGKHVTIKAPKNSGSSFLNYKEFYSVVMLAIVDAENKFTAVDIGSYGREGDAGKFIFKVSTINFLSEIKYLTGIYFKSNFGKQIRNHDFNIPSAQPLPGMNVPVPHVFVGR